MTQCPTRRFHAISIKSASVFLGSSRWKTNIPFVSIRRCKTDESTYFLALGFKYRMGMDQKDHYLTISKLNGDDTGHYECIANNVSTGADIYVEREYPGLVFEQE